MNKLIKSPLNYTGNKFRILEQIMPHFPNKINCMVDLFCGGATVGINVNSKKVIFVDNNERVLNLLYFLSKQNFEFFLNECEKVIEKYRLSYSYKYGYKKYRELCKNHEDNNGLKDYNTTGFYKLREDYNALTNKNSDKANVMLYMLMVYGFNNDIRFNKDGDYNLPIGKTDLNKNNVNKIKDYIERVKNLETQFICASFEDKTFLDLLNGVDFVYMDPPYLIGNAVYNSGWNSEKEHLLLDFIDILIEKKINFALSNVIAKVGRTNEPLSYWCYKKKDKIDVINIDYHYRSASYNKITRNAKEQEILIINKEYSHEDK